MDSINRTKRPGGSATRKSFSNLEKALEPAFTSFRRGKAKADWERGDKADGVVFYWPFSWQRVSLDWVFILDVVIWAMLGVTLVVALVLRRHAAWIWRAGLCLLGGYVGLCGLASHKSRELVSAQLRAESAEKAAIFVYPEPFGPTHYRVVARTIGECAVYEVMPFRKEIELLDRLQTEEQHPVVSAARHSAAGRRLDWFFSTAVWRLAPDGKTAIVYGLGFRTKLFRSRAPFVFRVAPDGRVWQAHLPS